MSKFYYISRNDFLGWWIFETNHKKRMLLTKTSSETIYCTLLICASKRATIYSPGVRIYKI